MTANEILKGHVSFVAYRMVRCWDCDNIRSGVYIWRNLYHALPPNQKAVLRREMRVWTRRAREGAKDTAAKYPSMCTQYWKLNGGAS